MTPLQHLAAALSLVLLANAPAAAQISFPEQPPSAAAPPAPPTATLPIAVAVVESFSIIQVCAPVNVLVIPTDGTNYTVTAEAEPAILQSLVAVIQNGTLQLQSSANFSTNNIISLQVSMPNNLTGVILSSPSSSITVAYGFSTTNFEIDSAFSSGAVSVLGIDAGNLSIANSGQDPTGSVLVNGTIGNATVMSSGTGSVYLLGTNTSVDVNLAGVSNVYLRNTDDNVRISGSTTGVNSVVYRNGICTIPSPFGFGGPCSQQATVNIPTINPQWTCGLAVTGNFTCAQASAAVAGTILSPQAASASTAPSLAAISGSPAATATGTQSATAVGSPGQPATASAVNNGTGVPPGSPITSNANAVSTNAPATANAASVGRKLKQFPSDFFSNFNAAFDNLSQGAGAVVTNGPGTQSASAIGSGSQNAFASGTNAFASAVSGTGLSPSTFTSGNGASASSEGASSQFGGTVQSLACTADPTLLNVLKSS